ERLAAVAGGLDVQRHLLPHRLLTEVLVEPFGADAGLDGLVLAGGGGADDALLLHRAMVARPHPRCTAPDGARPATHAAAGRALRAGARSPAARTPATGAAGSPTAPRARPARPGGCRPCAAGGGRCPCGSRCRSP